MSRELSPTHEHTLTIEQRLDRMEKEIESLKARNIRVESDKAWEQSIARISIITVVTYFTALLLLWSIGATLPLLTALVPASGYLLSVQSLPRLKRYWLSSRRDTHFQ